MKKVIYCDMDGVLADFNSEPNGVERFKSEKGFFFNLKPIQENVNSIKELTTGHKVFILTASPNESADQDKIKWLRKFMPFIPLDNVIICRNGQKKVDFMKSKVGILFDDYGKNCREWEEKKGNKSYQVKVDVTIKDLVIAYSL